MIVSQEWRPEEYTTLEKVIVLIIVFKSKAREILVKNFKLFLLPSSALMLSSVVSYLILNVFSSFLYWDYLNGILKFLCIALLFLVEFVVVPVSTVAIFKLYAILNSFKPENIVQQMFAFLNSSNIVKIVLINLLPNFVLLFLRINNAGLSELNIFGLNGVALATVIVISEFINYKVFAANYCFALNQESAIKSLKISFNTMKGSFWKYVLVKLSFILWAIVIFFIYAIIKMTIYGFSVDVFRIYSPVLDAFRSSGFGLDLYLYPFMYLTYAVFIDGLFNTNSKTADGSLS